MFEGFGREGEGKSKGKREMCEGFGRDGEGKSKGKREICKDFGREGKGEGWRERVKGRGKCVEILEGKGRVRELRWGRESTVKDFGEGEMSGKGERKGKEE